MHRHQYNHCSLFRPYFAMKAFFLQTTCCLHTECLHCKIGAEHCQTRQLLADQFNRGTLPAHPGWWVGRLQTKQIVPEEGSSTCSYWGRKNSTTSSTAAVTNMKLRAKSLDPERNSSLGDRSQPWAGINYSNLAWNYRALEALNPQPWTSNPLNLDLCILSI